MNQFQMRAMAGLAFDMAKVWFGGIVVGRLGLLKMGVVETLVALIGGLLCVMVGLHMGKEVKD